MRSFWVTIPVCLPSPAHAAEYLGHSGPAFTLRVYAHMLPSSHDRARAVIGDRFASFMITEQRRNSIRS